MSIKKLLVLVGVLLVAAVVLVACGGQTGTPETPDTPEMPAKSEVAVPFQTSWEGSAHYASDTEPFRHWDEEDPAEVPTSCAKCHSTQGYQDFMGADGSEAGVVDAAVPAAEVFGIECVACHNAATLGLKTVVFPSGVEVTGTDDSVRCMACHQGRESKISVDEFIAQFGEDVDPDAVPAPVNVDGRDVSLGFRNIHYYPAAATLYGGIARGGYQYDGKSYDGKFRHVEGIDSCIGCHDPHTLQVKVETCAMCHEGVAGVEDLKEVRMVSSASDYDGDGDTAEGVYYEIEGLQEALYAAIQAYAADTAGSEISYDPAAYPYWFDAAGENFAAWTPRLLKAAYNYQMAYKDPGKFAHGGKYAIQLLFDSIEDLGADVSGLAREDAGHFAGDAEAFRHWDEEGEVPGSCARCHSATGLPQYIKEGANISNEIANGFMCSTCHNEEAWPERYTVASVKFPSGAEVSFGGKDADGKFVADESNICMACHQGRESKVSVDAAIARGAFNFRNVHYFAAGATLFGADVQGAYMYDGKEYAGYFEAHPLNKCKDCHDVHALAPIAEKCAACHGDASFEEIRISAPDYDGDGDTTEGVKAELDALAEALYAEIQTYTEAQGTKAVYNANAYPYWFNEAGENFTAFDAKSLKAAYNYQYYQKDPGAFTHNGKFVAQFLIDSIADLGGNVGGYVRP